MQVFSTFLLLSIIVGQPPCSGVHQRNFDLPDDFEKKLTDVLERRNFVAHHYFWKRAMKFSHTRGQEEMLSELIQLSIISRIWIVN